MRQHRHGQREAANGRTRLVVGRVGTVGMIAAALGVALAVTVPGPAGPTSASSTTSCVTVGGTTTCVSLVGPRPHSVRWQ